MVVEEGLREQRLDHVVYRYLGRERPRSTSAPRTTRTTALGAGRRRLRAASTRTSARLAVARPEQPGLLRHRPLDGGRRPSGQRVRVHGPGRTVDLDLAANYTDLGFWKPVTGTELLPERLQHRPVAVLDDRRIVVLNDVRSETVAYVKNATSRPATSRTPRRSRPLIRRGRRQHLAPPRAAARSPARAIRSPSRRDHDEPRASKANAYFDNSDVDAAGDFTVHAQNLSQIDATTQSASSSGAQSLGFQLAFNSIGWKATNLLYNALDTLIGDPTIQGAFNGQQPAETLAYVTNSRVHANGNVSVSALAPSRSSRSSATAPPPLRPRSSAPAG